MFPHLHIDFETFSKADIKDVGAYRYAFDPSTEILCAAMAFDDETPRVWHPRLTDAELHWFNPYWNALENPDVLIYAHNAMFEMAIMQALIEKTWNIKCPALSRFRCTMSLARRASLPGSLDKLAEALNLSAKKDKRGSALLKKFSIMQKPKKPTKKNPAGIPEHRITPDDDPQAFQELLAYCAQDVVTEQEVSRHLVYFDEPINNANYSLDAEINARGVTVNLQALEHAQKLIDEETELVSAQFRQLTGFEVTQNAKLLVWINEQGYPMENLQAETIETFLEENDNAFTDPDVIEALKMKQSVAYASIKKVATMIDCAGPHDNRIRGMLSHHGATTGRWTASLVQFQNMKRPTIKHSEEAYREICAGISRDMLDVCYGAPLEVISSCIRHFVHDAEVCSFCGGEGGFDIEGRTPWEYGHAPCPECDGLPTIERPLFDADYAAIEARIVCWLAGQEDALDEYRAQDAAETKEEKERLDRYRIMASTIYGIPVQEVNKYPQRFIGKQAILLSGFQGGPKAFRLGCVKFGYKDMPAGLEDIAVETFRAKHRKVQKGWYDIERAAMRAIVKKGEVVKWEKLAFQCRDIEGMPFLLMRLPSGRKLAYPRPRLAPSRFEGKQVIKFFGRLGSSTAWGDVETYGGKLLENATQAVAADIMANGAHKAEAEGYQIATLIHDQALGYKHEGQTAERFTALLKDLPDWAEGLPIEAEGGEVPFYKKD